MDPNPAVIPEPLHLRLQAGRFRLTEQTRVRVDSGRTELTRIGGWLAEMLGRAGPCPHAVEVADEAPEPPGTVLLTHRGAHDALGAEGYFLEIRPEGVVLRSPSAAGIFYGVQTLRQLLPSEVEDEDGVSGETSLPCALVVDRPRFQWRGFLLDCCRHFMAPEFVRRMIDLLALHKMNRFHWHLTDDQGWRIEIRRRPRLTATGAWRSGPDGAPYGGFYTQDEVRDIVAYARQRYVTVVPEVEMPGHSRAALAAYPELGCTGRPLPVETRWGVFQDILCPGREETFTFLEDVLAEVLELFPGPYVHLGGDEAPRDRWRVCPRCQERVRQEGLSGVSALQGWLLRRIGRFLEERGRRIIGWDEILEGTTQDRPLPRRTIIQSWRGLQGAVTALRGGYEAIVSPTSHAYLDYGLDRIDLARVYEFEPVPAGLEPAEVVRILGGECNLWTERTPQDQVDSKAFPRLLAMAERLWSPADRRDLERFRRRLGIHYQRLDRLGVRYGPESLD